MNDHPPAWDALAAATYIVVAQPIRPNDKQRLGFADRTITHMENGNLTEGAYPKDKIEAGF